MRGGAKGPNGNCPDVADDGHPLQCVGDWALDKHHYLTQYIEATHAVRAKYLPPDHEGGAAFIDVFAGPGRIRTRDDGKIHDGSPMIAFRHERAPFTKLVLCDKDPANTEALRARTAGSAGRVHVFEGDSNQRIDDIVALVPEYGLNIALIDPFALSALKFSTVRKLAERSRMDLVLHFPTADIKRNLASNTTTSGYLDEALGTDCWRQRLKKTTDIRVLIEILHEQLASLGYGTNGVRSHAQPIMNDQNLPLYYLVYASKHPKGDDIWRSILKNPRSRQQSLFS